MLRGKLEFMDVENHMIRYPCVNFEYAGELINEEIVKQLYKRDETREKWTIDTSNISPILLNTYLEERIKRMKEKKKCIVISEENHLPLILLRTIIIRA